MKKRHLWLLALSFIISICMCFSLAACKDNNEHETTPVDLTVPVVSIDKDGVATWDNVPNASGYAYKINGGEEKTSENRSVTLSDKQSISVKAVGDGENYLDSEWSPTKTYNAPTPVQPVKLGAPVVTLNGAVASWNAIEHASGYKYSLDDGATWTNATGTSVTLNDKQTVIVKAIGDGKNYTDGDASAPVTYNAETPAQHSHDYAWTDNQDGTHSAVCIGEGDCDKPTITNEAHEYDQEGDKCVCGAEKPETPVQPVKLGKIEVTIKTDSTTGTIKAEWEAVTGATGYSVQIKDKGADDWDEPVTITLCAIEVTEGQSIRVKAIGDGTNYTTGDWSDVKTVPSDETPVQHTHKYTWTPNADGTTHNGVCANEDDKCDLINVTNENHKYGENDKCVCGAEKPADPVLETMTHAQFAAADTGAEVKVAGIVTAFRNKNVFLMDNDGGYYAFSATTVPENLAIGMAVTVTGTKDVYNGLDEVKDGVIEITSATPVTVTPVNITTALTNATAASDEALLAMQNTYVVFTGVITSNANGATIKVGEKDYTYYVGGSSQVVTTAQQTAIKEAFVAANGKTADVTAIVAIRDGAIQLVPANATPVSVHREPAKELGAPTLSLDEDTGVVTWARVNNAIGYKYVITTDGVEADPEDTTNRSVTITDGQSIKVMAVGDGVNYKDDDNPYSGVVTYNKTPLDTPVVTKSDSGAGAKWSEVENVAHYYYEITPESGEKRTGTTESLTIRLNDKDSIIVKAVASGEDRYKDSLFSTPYVHEAPADPTPLDAPTVTITRSGLATFVSEGAVSYEYKLNDGAATAATGNTYQLSDNDKIEVRAIGNTEDENSNFSKAKTYKAPVPYNDPSNFNFAVDTETEGNVVITWNAPSNTVEGVAPKYEVVYVVSEGGEEVKETVTTCSISIELKTYYSITVTVLAGTNTNNISTGDYSVRRTASNAVGIKDNLNAYIAEVKAAADTAAVAAEKAALANFLSANVVIDKDITLRTVGTTYPDVAIAWKIISDDEDVDDYAEIKNGVLSIYPSMTTELKSITVKATLTCGDATDEVSFPIEIKELKTAKTTVDITKVKGDNGTRVTSISEEFVDLTFAKGSNASSYPSFYGDGVRCYAGNTVTVSASNKKILKIELTYISNSNADPITATTDANGEGALDKAGTTWTGEATSVTLTVGGTKGNKEFTKIIVTYEQPTDEEYVDKAIEKLAALADTYEDDFFVDAVATFNLPITWDAEAEEVEGVEDIGTITFSEDAENGKYTATVRRSTTTDTVLTVTATIIKGDVTKAATYTVTLPIKIPAAISNKPVVKIDDDGFATWLEVDNAESYVCQKKDADGEWVDCTAEIEEYDIDEVTERIIYVVILTDGQSIQVMAVGDGYNYSESDWSTIKTYAPNSNEPKPIDDAPVVNIGEDGKATWAAVTGAVSYAYQLKNEGGEWVDGTETIAYDSEKELYYVPTALTVGQSIQVKAIGNGTDYTQSEWSEAATYAGAIPQVVLTIDVTSFNTTSYAANNGDHTIDGYTVNTNQVMKQGNDMQLQSSKGTIKVTGTFTKLVITSSAGTYTVTAGGETVTGTDGVYEITGGEQEIIIKVGGATGKISSIIFYAIA